MLFRSQTGGGNGRKQAQAVRIADGSIRVDGRLDDAAWGGVAPITDFLQREPDEGAPATDAMEVRIAYDAGEVDLQARIRVRANGKLVDSTCGRVIASPAPHHDASGGVACAEATCARMMPSMLRPYSSATGQSAI